MATPEHEASPEYGRMTLELSGSQGLIIRAALQQRAHSLMAVVKVFPLVTPSFDYILFSFQKLTQQHFMLALMMGLAVCQY